MTDQEHLERSCRRLLAWYPREFRRESGQEILAVLMACAADGQRRPGLAQSADLIRSGLRMRLRPRVPRSARTVRAAVRLMYAGAAVSTVNLIRFLAGIKAYHAVTGLIAGQVSQLNTSLFSTQVIVAGLVPIALWLWMAQANGQGRNWARSLFTVLFGLYTVLFGAATLQCGLVTLQSLIHAGSVPMVMVPIFMVMVPIFPVLTWLAAAAAVWLLWLPASSAFFRPQFFAHAPRQAEIAELARIRSSRARWARQV
jgi:hypothetical protein